MRKLLVCLLVLLGFVCMVEAQTKKSVEAFYIDKPLIIDGKLDEPVYHLALPANDFVQLQPYNGKPSFQPSEVYFFYDKTSIYVGAMLYDSAPDSIFNLLTERDNTGMSDYFGVYIDPYNQGQLAYGFFITPAGVQVDIKAVKSDGDYEDSNWNAVWQSKTDITDKGWIVEMCIPFSALRFSETTGGAWGLNMFRNIRRYNSNNSWNFVDRNVSGFIHQEGQLTGIKDVKPPVRLSFSPYLATYFETKDKGASNDFIFKGGMDVKYGINESFTLDMMLIPDFGQIQSDDKELNLSPYELYYDEKRQFFTEGTELFQRADVFYSRRIGASPKFSADDFTSENETVDFNPSETQLINATKISGRTRKGWGLGLLNAMSLSSYAELKDTLTGIKREVQVQPFTNYNVAVVDKSLKNNSYVSLINTNVDMADHQFGANVTATEFQLRDKSKTYALNGKGGFSSRGTNNKEEGFQGVLGMEKNKGKFQYGLTQRICSDTYNPNDLGYLQQNNQVTSELYVYHQHVEPKGIFREYNFSLWWDYLRMYNPNTLFGNKMGYNANAQFKNNYYANVNGGYATDIHDYFETRTQGRYYLNPRYFWNNINLSTDSRKKLSFYFHLGNSVSPTTDMVSNYGDFEAAWRVGQRFQMWYAASFRYTANGVGYVDKQDDRIYFAKRDVSMLANVLSSQFVFNNKASLSLRARHYWSAADNKIYFLLQPDGSLADASSYTDNKDQNYNAFTVDMVFRWNFAPGSELALAWKNSAYDNHDLVTQNYFDNLSKTWENAANSFSLKVLYYLDYNSLRKGRIQEEWQEPECRSA